MGRPPRSDGQRTRQAILDAALTLFAEKGYFGTSLRDIARAVGVRESALYNYFSGKEALFHALIEAMHERRAERMSPFIEAATGDARSLLEKLTTEILTDFSAPRAQALFRVLLSDGMRLALEGRLNLLDRMTSGAAPLRTLMRRLIAAGSLRRRSLDVLAAEFVGPLLMWRHWYTLDPKSPLVADRAAFVRGHVDHFLQGSGAVEDSGTRALRVSGRRPTARARRGQALPAR
jgi:AcrR family transcriptional regulator